jgi:hypothetical protein
VGEGLGAGGASRLRVGACPPVLPPGKKMTDPQNASATTKKNFIITKNQGERSPFGTGLPVNVHPFVSVKLLPQHRGRAA